MYDIARQRTVPINVDHGRILAAKFNPFNNLFVGLTNVESIIIMDKDLNTVTSSKWEVKLDQNNRRLAKVNIIDEYTMIATADVSRVYDLRMMKSILTIPKPVCSQQLSSLIIITSMQAKLILKSTGIDMI